MIRSPSEKVQWKDAPNYPVKEEAFSGNAPNRLWRILQRDEYDLLSNTPLLEGNFVQVTKKGEHVSILNHPTIITIGILATNPKLPFPDLMIIAREKRRRRDRSPMTKDLEITRLVSLDMVELFLDNLDEQRIKVQMMKGQKYYLRFYAPGQDESLLFDQWLRLIYLMHLARGRIKRPPSVTSKEPGQRSTSVLGLSTKKHWLPAVMDQSSTGHLKAQLCQIHSSKETQCSAESGNASKQSLLKSDLAALSSLSPLATSGSRRRASKRQSLHTASRATKRSQVPQAGSSNFRKPESKERSKPKQMSPQLTSKRTLGSATRLEGTGHPQTQAVAPSPAAHQTSATGPSQMKNVKQPSAMKPGNVPIAMTSTHSRHAPVKLQKSKKSRALKKSHETKRKKATVKSQKRNPVPPKSLVPPTQDRHAAASKTSSVMRKKSSSRLVSSTMPFTSPAPECHVSVAPGPPEKQTVSVATGSSEAILVSTASGPSRPTTQVMAEVRGSAEKSREPRKPMSRRPKASSSPSPKRGRSTSPNPTEEEEYVVTLHRTMESVAVGPSQVGYTSVAVGPSTGDNTLTSRPQSRALGTGKRSESGDRSRGQKVKDKKRNQPSSKTEKQKKSRSKESESKSKLKSALSSAKQKSSLTFITLYSVISLSFEKMKRSKSKDDSKVLSPKPSKRVTISGVDGPSGKGVQQLEEAGDSAKNRLPTSPRTDNANPVGQK